MFVQYSRDGRGGFVRRECSVIPSELGGRILLTFVDQVPEDHYILCVTYNDGKTQLGMTGTMKEEESALNAMYREIQEETGLIVDGCVSVLGTYHTTKRGKDLFWHFGLCDVSEYLIPIVEGKGYHQEQDSRKDLSASKIAVFLHARLEDWEYLFSSCPDTILEKYIVALTLVPRDEVQNVFFVNQNERVYQRTNSTVGRQNSFSGRSYNRGFSERKGMAGNTSQLVDGVSSGSSREIRPAFTGLEWLPDMGRWRTSGR